VNWTHDGQRWTLSAAPRYAVGYRADDDYPMLIDGHEVDSATTSAQAQGQLEARFEYEEHGSELELARLRLRQARERLKERYPRAAKDAELSCALEGLGDALGVGPEASEPATAAEPAAGAFARQLSPELVVGTDSSQCIVLLVGGTGPKDPIRKVDVTNVDAMKAALDDARTAQHIALEEADAARLHGPDEARGARGQLGRYEAVEWLVGKGYGRNRAAGVTRALQVDGGSVLGMTYEDGYWVVPA
jgi:hypothetical protein